MSNCSGPWAQSPIRTFLVGSTLASLHQRLATSSDIEVSGTAKNGQEALEHIPRSNPQVICTELEMPVMDGLDLTRGIMATDPRAILVVSRLGQQENLEKMFQVFEAGAIEVFPMPDNQSEHAIVANVQALINKIKILSGVMVSRRRQIPSPKAMRPNDRCLRESFQSIPGLVVIGASTGGPQALKEILAHLSPEFPLPIVCVQHISQGFLPGLVDWLAVDCDLPIAIAETGKKPQAGTVYFPPEGRHLKFDTDGQFLVEGGPKVDDHLPSVTVVFQSAAHRFGRHAIGVLLTGMGQDGVDGMLAISGQGGLTIAQNEQSCVVFGMPQRAIELNAASHILPLQDIASLLISAVAQYATCEGADTLPGNE